MACSWKTAHCVWSFRHRFMREMSERRKKKNKESEKKMEDKSIYTLHTIDIMICKIN